MAEAKTHHGKVVRKFTDAGTGQTYEEGAAETFDAGAFENYVRAGLVAKPDTKAADKAA